MSETAFAVDQFHQPGRIFTGKPAPSTRSIRRRFCAELAEGMATTIWSISCRNTASREIVGRADTQAGHRLALQRAAIVDEAHRAVFGAEGHAVGQLRAGVAGP